MVKYKSLNNGIVMELLDTEERLCGLVNDWQTCDWIAVDTEFMRFRTYYPKLCLIQMHSSLGTVGIDTLNIQKLDVLRRLFESKTTELIMHACEQDLEALAQHADFKLNALFDTQIASLFCGYSEAVGYARLVKDLCGVEIEKDQTRSDWSKRPLTSKQWEYAKNDVIYLKQIHEILESQLEDAGKLGWFREVCSETVKLSSQPVRPKDVWPQFSDIEVPEQAREIARELVVWRERRAQSLDIPRRWVLSNQTLVELCVRRPRNLHHLRHVSSLSERNIKTCGPAIIAIVRKHRRRSNYQAKWTTDTSDESFKKDVKLVMGMLRSAAEERGIAPRLLGSRKDVESLIRGNSSSKIMKGWRYEVLGYAIQQHFG